jgi:quercetin dioxygenase-like cupin family protein
MPKTAAAAPLASGTIHFNDRHQAVGQMDWVPHPKFRGASMKHLVKKADNDDLASCHLVRIDPGCRLDDHLHEGEWEYHNVLEGSGKGYLEGKEMDYVPGTMAVIPKGQTHKVIAGEDGMLIMATFLPGLL